MSAVMQVSMPADAVAEMLTGAMPVDERLWLPRADDVWAVGLGAGFVR